LRNPNHFGGFRQFFSLTCVTFNSGTYSLPAICQISSLADMFNSIPSILQCYARYVVSHLLFRIQERGGRHLLCRVLNHWLPPSKGPNSVCVSPPSPEDRNQSNFQKVVFIVFRILDDGQSPQTQ
jgi:hypothetical protein